MTNSEIVEIIAGNIISMLENNADCNYEEQFTGWCEDGDAFDDGTLKIKDKVKLFELMELVAPHVDEISYIFSQYLKDEN